MKKIGCGPVKMGRIFTGPLIVLLFLILIFGIAANGFFKINNAENILRQSSMLALVAIGQCIAILMAGIDLSQGSVMGLTSVCTALILANHVPLIPGLLLGLGVGLLCGLINGWFIAYTKMPEFVATFGMSGMALGLGLVISNERVIWGFPQSIRLLEDGSILHIPSPLIIYVLAYLLFYYLLRYTTFGTGIYAIGGNQSAAELSGIPVKKYKLIAYGLSGLMAGAAGIMMMARMNSAQAIIGVGYEFDAIAAVVLGGTAMTGGKGGMIQTLLGVIIIAVVRNGLNLMGVNVYLQLVAIGLIIILAYIFDHEKTLLKLNFLSAAARNERGKQIG